MLKSFIQKNLYLVVGCLLMILLIAAGLHSVGRSVEGLDGFQGSSYSIVTCNDSNWTPIIPSDNGFYFASSNYRTIYVLTSPIGNMSTLMKSNRLFNVDCKNVLYSKNANKTFNKYTLNNSIVLYENASTGSFFDCFKKLLNDAKTNTKLYYKYDSKSATPYIQIYFTYDGSSDIKRTFAIKFNLKAESTKKMNNAFSDYLSKTHQIYGTPDFVSSYSINLNANTTYDLQIYKKDNTKDTLTNVQKIIEDSSLIDILKSLGPNDILSIYDVKNNSKMNLASSYQTYIYGRINIDKNYCYSIGIINKI